MQCACTILSSVACPAVQHFFSSHKRQDFRLKKFIGRKMCIWFPLKILSETFLILRRNKLDMFKNVYWFSCKVPVIPVRFWWKFETSIFSTNFRKNLNKYHENRFCGAQLFHAGGRRDRHDKANSRFSKFYERS